jgi:hypothetical protein
VITAAVCASPSRQAKLGIARIAGGKRPRALVCGWLEAQEIDRDRLEVIVGHL